MIPFIDLQAQRAHIASDVDAAIARVLEHGQFIMGPEVATLEHDLSAFCGATHSITCANGTDALQLALMALGVKAGDAVFAPSFTFVATVEAVALIGATPVFVDVDDATFNLCPESLSESIDAVIMRGKLMPKAVITVDLFGQPANYDRVAEIARAKGLSIISDAAQSFGASLNGQKVGVMGDIATTSFFPAKPLGCYGDGGALSTEGDNLAALIRSLRNHGQGEDRYDNVRVGLNSRLDSIQAAILIEKLKIFPDEIIARDKIATRYRDNLPAALRSQAMLKGATSVWAQYTVISENRDDIRAALSAADIPSAVYYPRPAHLQGPYAAAPRAPQGLPVTEHLQSRAFSLPMHPYLDNETQDRILAVLDDCVKPL